MSDEDGVWIPTYSVGTYGGLDERFKRRRRKRPLGFAPPPPKPVKRKKK